MSQPDLHAYYFPSVQKDSIRLQQCRKVSPLIPMALPDLAPELITLIATSLDRPTLNSLTKTSRYFHKVLTPLLNSSVEKDQFVILHWAAVHNSIPAVHIARSHGATFTGCYFDDLLPLHVAAAHGSLEVATLMISLGAEVDYEDIVNETALQYAIREGQSKMVSLLIDAGANIQLEKDCWQSPLLQAITKGDIDVVRILIENGAAVDQPVDRGLPLHWAVWGGRKDIVQLLLEAGASIDYQNDMHPTEQGDPPMRPIDEYYRQVTEPQPGDSEVSGHGGNEVESSEVHQAQQDQSEELHSESGQDGDNHNSSEARSRKPTEEQEFGIEDLQTLMYCNYPTPSNSSKKKYYLSGTPFHWAIEQGDTEMVKFLLERGANLSLKNREQQTPLKFAMMLGRKEYVQILTEAGASSD